MIRIEVVDSDGLRKVLCFPLDGKAIFVEKNACGRKIENFSCDFFLGRMNDYWTDFLKGMTLTPKLLSNLQYLAENGEKYSDSQLGQLIEEINIIHNGETRVIELLKDMKPSSAVFEITENQETTWGFWKNGDDALKLLGLLECVLPEDSRSAGVFMCASYLKFKMKDHFTALSEEQAQEYRVHPETASFIHIDFKNGMLSFDRDNSYYESYCITINDALSIYHKLGMPATYEYGDCTENIEYQDLVISFLNRENEHLQNLSCQDSAKNAKKRFRNRKGSLNISVDELAEKTAPEVKNYYVDGEVYVHANKIYLCRLEENNAKFVGEENSITVPLKSLGTFLPDIASDGQGIHRLPIKQALEMREQIQRLFVQDEEQVSELKELW